MLLVTPLIQNQASRSMNNHIGINHPTNQFAQMGQINQPTNQFTQMGQINQLTNQMSQVGQMNQIRTMGQTPLQMNQMGQAQLKNQRISNQIGKILFVWATVIFLIFITKLVQQQIPAQQQVQFQQRNNN